MPALSSRSIDTGALLPSRRGGLKHLWVNNTDHRLLIIDGLIENSRPNELMMNSNIDAMLLCGEETVAHLTPLTETDQGSALHITLFPFETARILFYCEIAPEVLDKSAPLTVKLRGGTGEYIISLDEAPSAQRMPGGSAGDITKSSVNTTK